NEGQPGFGDPRTEDLAEPPVVLVDLIGAAVDRDQKLSALCCEVSANGREPAVLADRQAKLHPAPFNNLGKRTGSKDALFVKGPIVRKLMLAPRRHDATFIEQGNDIVEPPLVVALNRAYEHRR